MRRQKRFGFLNFFVNPFPLIKLDLWSLKFSTFRPVSQHLSEVEYIQDFEDESQTCPSTKEWIFIEWMDRFDFGDIDFVKNIRFSYISQRWEAVGVSILNTNTLCFFKETNIVGGKSTFENCWKIVVFAKCRNIHLLFLVNLWLSIGSSK